MGDKMTIINTEHMRCLLRKRFSPPEWALLEEVAPSTGGGTGYADAVAMNLWKSRGHVVYGFEIKISRGDWQRELKKPAKAESVFTYCDGWYVVTPAGIVKDGELPATWGHLELHGSKLIEKVKAPKLSAKELDRPFFASLMRRGFENLDQIAESKQRQAIYEARAEIDARVENEIRQRTRSHEKLREAVKEWEEATGLKFDTYGGPSKRIIQMAQKLEDIHHRYSSLHGETGFGYLASLAEDLSRAAEIVRTALPGSEVQVGQVCPQEVT